MHRSALGALIQRGIFVQPLRDYLFSKGRNHATSVVIPPRQGAESCNECRDYSPGEQSCNECRDSAPAGGGIMQRVS